MSLLRAALALCWTLSALADDQVKFFEQLPTDQDPIGVKTEMILTLLANQNALRETVERQEQQIGRLERIVEETASRATDRSVEREHTVAGVFRSCEEIRLTYPGSESGTYWIDPDGIGSGDPPISVHCDMVEGSTLISHYSESEMEVDPCPDAGCYSRSVVYNATMRQMVTLSRLSKSCRQFFRFDCLLFPFESSGVQQAWWTDRNGHPQFYWAGDNDTAHTCQCGIDGNCIVSNVKCNCDSAAAASLIDQGYITNKDALPVTKLNFGGPLTPSSYGRHTLGPFKCSGRTTLDGMPESCEELWQTGHTLNGFYDVKGNKTMRSVYCDFSKIPEGQGIEVSVGSVDIKSSPVYFYVKRSSSFNVTSSTTIPFEIEELNVGGGMNVSSGIFRAPRAGIYFFSFSGVSENINTVISLQHNVINVANSQTSTANFSALSLTSILNLKAGDRIHMQLFQGTLRNVLYYTNFVGVLLQEDLSL